MERPSPIIEVSGKRVLLTPIEQGILIALVSRRGRAVSKQRIIEDAWGSPDAATDYALKTRVSSLRKKIHPMRIDTVRGYGYMIDT